MVYGGAAREDGSGPRAPPSHVQIGTRRNQEMKHFNPTVFVVALALAVLVAAVSGCTVGGEVKEYRDPAKTIVVEKGSEFAIVLESNPTTGYQWKLAGSLDTEVITLVKTEFEESESELLGAPGEEKWTFKAVGLGDAVINLIYVRPWEEEEQEVSSKQGEEKESLSEGESGEHEETPETGTSPEETGEATGVEEEQPTTMTFHVEVVKAGSTTKEPKKYEDPETEIEAEKGTKFVVVLESNPTTGYQWQLAQPADESVVELVSTEYEKKGSEIGSGGTDLWTFKAKGVGNTKLDFVYVRPWEKDAHPEEEKTFSVTVTAPEESGGGE
jgi:inhibitor of cysteine peptidase